MVNKMKSLIERIGEAFLSLGKINFVVAYDAYEEHQLKSAGFIYDGKVDFSNQLYSIYKIQHKNNNTLDILEEQFFELEPVDNNKKTRKFNSWDEWVYLNVNDNPGAHGFKL